MAGSGGRTLAQTGQETFSLFKQVAAINQAPENSITTELWPKASFMAEADRFELWAINLGLFVPGHGSLDYRVREAESLCNTFQTFLADLNDSLLEVLEYCNNDSNTAQLDREQSIENMRSQRESVLEWSEEDLDASTDQEAESDMDLLLDSVRDIIDRLYKLATKIRNPSTRLTYSKAQYFQDFDENSGVDLLQAFEHFDYDYVSAMFLQYKKSKALLEHPPEKVPNAQHAETDADDVWNPIYAVLSQYQDDIKAGRVSFLIPRIARSNMRRRQQFGYWKRHRDKLAKHTHVVASLVQIDAVGTETRTHQPQLENAPLLESALGPRDNSAPSVTTASRLNPSQLNIRESESTMSISEYAPSACDPGKEVVEFPPPPKRVPGNRFFDCPYCFTLCSNEFLAEKAWKAHLIRDLRPYICTYEDCKSANQLYDTRRDWIQYENSFHRRIWRCPEHPDLLFLDIQTYQQHLHSEHAQDSKAMSSEWVLQASETISTLADRCCPICSLYLEHARPMQNHIALHLERFALFSIPRSVDDEASVTQDTRSDNANPEFQESRDGDFESTSDVRGDGDPTTSVSSIARKRWRHVLDKVSRDLLTKRKFLRSSNPYDLCIFDVLFATGPNETTPQPGPESFTSAFIWALKELGNDWSYSSSEILKKILHAPNFPLNEQHPGLVNIGIESLRRIVLEPPSFDVMKPVSETAKESLGRYKKVSVCLLHWEQDPSNRSAVDAQDEIDLLSEFFTNTYHFSVRKNELRIKEGLSVGGQVRRFLADWAYEEDDYGNLMTLYYAGHGCPASSESRHMSTPEGEPARAKSSNDWSEVVWKEVESMKEIAFRADIFVILDCSGAGGLFRTR